jgi:hypothetical protein
MILGISFAFAAAGLVLYVFSTPITPAQMVAMEHAPFSEPVTR